MTKISKKTFKKATIGSGGILANIARRLSVSRGAITQYLNRNPEMVKYIEEEKQSLLDLAELQLIIKLKQGDFKAIKFFLMSKGKERGYIINKELNIYSQNKELSLKEKFEEFKKINN